MASNAIIVFDTETGGLSPKKAPIMELALIVKDVETWKELTRWETLVKGYNGLIYEPKALEVHGISVSEANNNGMELIEFVATLIKLFKKFTPKGDRGGGRPILAGHNVGFDVAMLKEAFSLAGEDLNNYVLSSGMKPCLETVTFDTLPMAKFVWHDEGKLSYKLGDCCKRAGLGDFVAHRAMPDVIASCDLMEYFRTRFNTGKKSNEGEQETKAKKGNRNIIDSPKDRIKFQF